MKATSSFLTSLENKEDTKLFSPIIEPMMNTIIAALQQDEQIGWKALEAMIILAEFHPDLFENYCATIVNICSQIMENKEFEPETRNYSTEFICIIGEMYPSLLRRTEEIKTKFYPALFKMMTEVELPEDDEQEEWL